jgi:hypothetical protein
LIQSEPANSQNRRFTPALSSILDRLQTPLGKHRSLPPTFKQALQKAAETTDLNVKNYTLTLTK